MSVRIKPFYIFSSYFKIAHWGKIRTLGELQVITKASYIMLIVVPILAAIWPVVGSRINRYNKGIVESTIQLEDAALRLKYQAESVALLLDTTAYNEIKKSTVEIIGKVNAKVDSIISDYSELVIEKKQLPLIWVLIFLASLAIFIGQLLYQANAPDLIKNNSRNEFVSAKKTEFASNPTDFSLKAALHYINQDEEKQRPPLPDPKMSRAKQLGDDLNNPSFSKEEMRRKEIEIIEEGAMSEFRILSRINPQLRILTSIFYVVGIGLLVIIVANQTRCVLEAAGWFS